MSKTSTQRQENEARRQAAADRLDEVENLARVRVYSPSHWRVTTPAGAVFDYHPTSGKWSRLAPSRDTGFAEIDEFLEVLAAAPAANLPPEPEPPLCLHCDQPARLTSGREVYPHRQDLWGRSIWRCDSCDAHCGCHRGGLVALGRPADRPTRRARMELHTQRLDPIWLAMPKGRRRPARSAVYAFLALRMGLTKDEAHTALWTLEQCREAWGHLHRITLQDVEAALAAEREGVAA